MIPTKQHRKIGDLLLEANLITESDLARCLQLQKQLAQPIGEILVKERLITEEQLLRTLAAQMNFTYIDLQRIVINEEVLQIIHEDIAKRYQILPIDQKENTLTIATSDPLNMSTIDDLYFITNYDIDVVIASKKDIEWGINRYYLPQHEHHINELTQEDLNDTNIDSSVVQFLEEEQSPANTLIQSIINKAVARRASDIHIEQFENETLVRFRIDGILYDMMTIPSDLKSTVISRLKIMSNLRITDKRKPQDGGFHIKIDGHLLDIRISTMPTIFGEKIVLRLLHKENTYQLDEQGFLSDNLSKLRKAVSFPNGIVLITGPTGSGKTTTLYSILNEINTIEKNIMTIEDPVEYMFPRINQIQINPRAGLTFASGLRSILRQDPDIILVGEIRDEETASIAVQAALTGHLVLTTLHTNTAIGSVYRLVNMGIEPYLLASSVRGMVTQRLARHICPECKQEVRIEPEVLQRIGLQKPHMQDMTFYQGRGCFMCQGTGFRGRIAIQEVIVVDDHLNSLITSGATEMELRKVLSQTGHRTLFDDGYEKVQLGLTTLQEFLRVVAD